jgi:hypothetical protein
MPCVAIRENAGAIPDRFRHSALQENQPQSQINRRSEATVRVVRFSGHVGDQFEEFRGLTLEQQVGG